jgi:hypothetical protein
MAQYTVNLDPAYGTQVEIRLCRPSSKEATTFTVRNGETIVSDDPELIAALGSLVGLERSVLAPRAARPAAPTHDADRKPREPAPTGAPPRETKPAEPETPKPVDRAR